MHGHVREAEGVHRAQGRGVRGAGARVGGVSLRGRVRLVQLPLGGALVVVEGARAAAHLAALNARRLVRIPRLVGLLARAARDAAVQL